MAVLLVVVVLLVGLGGALGLLALTVGRARRALRWFGATGLLAVAYVLVLVAVGLLSRPRVLALGELKCFDDWCVTLRSVQSAPSSTGELQLVVAVSNNGRGRAQRPDTPQAFLVTGSGVAPLSVPGLDQRLEVGQTVGLTVTVLVPPDSPELRLLVTEGGFPSRLVVGDENSPWHATSSWRL